MRRLIALTAAACVALLMGTGAFAQVPPNSDNPNDAIPDTLTPPPYGQPYRCGPDSAMSRSARNTLP